MKPPFRVRMNYLSAKNDSTCKCLQSQTPFSVVNSVQGHPHKQLFIAYRETVVHATTESDFEKAS